MYINDLNNVSNEILSILFADDTSVFIEGDNIESAIEILNSELEKISTWLTENKLNLNVSKSHFMIFHRTRIKTDSIKIALGKSRIKQVPFTKFLGVIIDDNLNFDNHISYIKNKISKGLGILIKAKKYLNIRILMNLYYTFVYPYLIYCVDIWGHACNIYLDPIVKLQKKIIRIMTFSDYNSHSAPLFLSLKMLLFTKIVVHRIGMQMYKYNHNTVPLVIRELFEDYKHIHQHNTRQKEHFRHPFGKQEYMYRNLSFTGIYIWNFILNKTNINIMSSYALFKCCLKNFLFFNDITFRIL